MNEQVWRCPACTSTDDTPFYFQGKDFACPQCQGPGDPVERIHYLAVDAEGPIKTGIGNRRRACAPLAVKLPKYATGERSAVSCPQCIGSDVFKKHAAEGVDQHVDLLEGKNSVLRQQVGAHVAKKLAEAAKG